MAATWGRTEMLDLSGYNGWADVAAIEARVPTGCRDVVLNLDAPPPTRMQDTGPGNYQRFRARRWRISLYHELDLGVGSAQASYIERRLPLFEGSHRLCLAYEANPVIPPAETLTDTISAIGDRYGRLVFYTYKYLWTTIPLDVRRFVAERCDGWFANPSRLTVPADYPPLVAMQWALTDLAGAVSGPTTDVDTNSIDRPRWAPFAQEILETDVTAIAKTPNNPAVYMIDAAGKRHIEGGQLAAAYASGAHLYEQMTDAEMANINDAVTPELVERIVARQLNGRPWLTAQQVCDIVAEQLRIALVPTQQPAPPPIDYGALAVAVADEMARRMES
jgi:hypothetical protein